MCAWQGTFFEAFCQEIDPAKKEIVACVPPGPDMDEACFKIAYDILLIGVWWLQSCSCVLRAPDAE